MSGRPFQRLRSDDRAQAIAEYVLLAGLIITFCIYLMDPDNGLYGGIRIVYDRISYLTMLPGP
jgi:hypothetical protein